MLISGVQDKTITLPRKPKYHINTVPMVINHLPAQECKEWYLQLDQQQQLLTK